MKPCENFTCYRKKPYPFGFPHLKFSALTVNYI
jgi:hypothetical protein